MRSQSGLGGQRCVIALNDELRKFDAQLARLTKKAAPRLLARFGIGPQTATTLLISAGDNPTTLHGESAIAALCDTSPHQASSGKVHRRRLNRDGDLKANNAVWTIIMVPMQSDARTQQHVVRHTGEGLYKKEIRHRLKCYIVRELYLLTLADLKDSATSARHKSANAMMEQLFLNLKLERDWQKDYGNRAEAVENVANYIVGFYNNIRLHSKLGNLLPNALERESTSKKSIQLSEII